MHTRLGLEKALRNESQTPTEHWPGFVSLLLLLLFLLFFSYPSSFHVTEKAQGVLHTTSCIIHTVQQFHVYIGCNI